MDTIDRAADLLHGRVAPGTPSGQKVAGSWRGRPVIFEDVLGSPVIVTVPVRTGELRLDVRRQHGWAEREIARGELVDVVIGEAEFDAAMLIDAAPADVVRMVFSSASLRKKLIGLDELASLRTIGDALVLEVVSCGAAGVEALLDVAVDAAIAIEAAHDLADREAARAGTAVSLYRGQGDHAAVEAGRDADIKRRDDLKRTLMRREVAYLSVFMVMVLGLVAAGWWILH